MKKTIQTGIRKPAEKSKGAAINPSIDYGMTSASSDFDKRASVGSTKYVGPSQMGGSGLKNSGNKQSKKHKSAGGGQ